jgi:uncharacterized coiled-coil protein SlyX
MIVAMSSSVTRVVDPLDLHDASRERLLAEIGLLQHRYSLTDPGRLEARIRELEAQLGSAEDLRVTKDDAQVAKHDAQVAKHDTQVTELKNEIDDLKMSLLHTRDYARGCAAELGEARTFTEHDAQVTELKNEIDDLKMSLLHTRDYARGCAAELGEARTFFEIHIADRDRKVRQARKKNQQIYATRTWKMGRLVMLPIRIVRRIVKVSGRSRATV